MIDGTRRNSSTRGRVRLIIAAVLASTSAAFAETVAVPTDAERIQSVAALANKLTDWAFLIIGATILVLISTSYRMPKRRSTRNIYLLFLPAWICLARALYFGVQVQGGLLAFVLAKDRDFMSFRASVGEDFRTMTSWFEWGVGVLGVWLVVYLLWWLYGMEPEMVREGGGR